MADPASIGALITSGLTGLATVISAVKGGDREERIKALEAASKAAGEEREKLRKDLDSLAVAVRDGADRSPAAQTGSHTAVREPLSSVPDRELDGRVRALETWKAMIDGWKEGVGRELSRAIELAQEARDEMIRIVERVRAARDVRRGDGRDSR